MNLDFYIEKINRILLQYPHHLNFLTSVSFQQKFHDFIKNDIALLIKDEHYASAFSCLMYLLLVLSEYQLDETSYNILLNEISLTILNMYNEAPDYDRHLIYVTLMHMKTDGFNKSGLKSITKLINTIKLLYEKEKKL